MPKDEQFVMADPAYFEGDPFEVAERTLVQLEAMAKLVEGGIDDAEAMALNAEMERNIYLSDSPHATDWETSPQKKRLDKAREHAYELRKILSGVAVAAAYRPPRPQRRKSG